MRKGYWGLLVWLWLPWIAWGETVQITVFPEAMVAADEITIGAIADVQGDAADLVALIRNIVVGQAPQPGEERSLYGPYLATRLKQAGLDETDFILDAPAKIRVTRAAQRLESTMLENIVRQALTRQMPQDAAQVTIRDLQGLEDLVVPPGPLHYNVAFPRHNDFTGRVAFTLEVRVHGKLARRLYGNVHVDVLQKVVTLTRAIAPQEVITAADIRLQAVSLARASQQIVTRPEEIIGRRARRALPANTAIRSRDIEVLPLIHKGDQVLIIAESDLIKVTAIGEALEHGQQGETIRIKNPASNREIRAVVIGPKTVRIAL